MYSKVLCHLWIVFDTHKLNFCEFLFEDHLPSMDDDGRFGKMMEDDGRWPMDIGKCTQRSCVIFGSFLIPISWISVNFYLRIIFHQWKMMEDEGRWWKRRWKMTYGHWKMCSKVLCHLWIVFDTHELHFCEFYFRIIFHQWKMMEDELWTLVDVLKGLRSSLDHLQYP